MKKIFLIQLILFSVIAFAQPPTRFFTKFGGNGVDIGYSGKPTLDRHYIVAGSTSSYGSGNTDVYLVKVDSMGFVKWERTFGGFNNDVAKSVVQLTDSGYVVAGFTNSFGNGGYDVYVIRTDKDGNQLWQKTFGGTDWDFANDVVLTPDGDIAVVGNTSSFGSGKKDGLFLKFDYSGNLVQQKYFGGVENEELRSIIVTADFMLATVGYTESKGEINGDCYFLKLNLSGDTLFTKTFGGTGKDYLNDIALKATGDFVLCGAKTYSVKTESFMCGLSATGAYLWDNHYIASSDDEFFISVSNSYELPTFHAFLRTIPVPTFKLDGNLFLASPTGYYYKINSFCGTEDEVLYSLEPTKDGGFLCVGSTLSFGSIGEDVFLIKHDSTMYNYTNAVGIKKNVPAKKPVVFYKQQQLINITLPAEELPVSMQLIDLNGEMVKEFTIESENTDINMAGFASSIYIARFKDKSGNIYYHKLINK